MVSQVSGNRPGEGVGWPGAEVRTPCAVRQRAAIGRDGTAFVPRAGVNVVIAPAGGGQLQNRSPEQAGVFSFADWSRGASGTAIGEQLPVAAVVVEEPAK